MLPMFGYPTLVFLSQPFLNKFIKIINGDPSRHVCHTHINRTYFDASWREFLPSSLLNKPHKIWMKDKGRV